jgi:hypothetical protein
MLDADYILIEALLDDLLDPTMIRDAIDEALALLQDDDGRSERLDRLQGELASVEQESMRLVSAIAAEGNLAGLLDAVRARGTRLERLLERCLELLPSE